MIHKLLLPNRFKLFGWSLSILAIISQVIVSILNNDNHFKSSTESQLNSWVYEFSTNPINAVLFIVGGLFVCFSKEKKEDEFIAELRLSSLLWAVLVNYILLIFAFIFIYGFAFIDVIVYNMVTVLIIFIARFNYLLYKNSKIVSAEK